MHRSDSFSRFASLWLAAVLGSALPLASGRAEGTGLIAISEIMYHPRGGGRDLEYVELVNLSPAPIDLSGWFFSRGISYVFPDGTWLDGKQFLVVVADRARFLEEYGVATALGDWAECSGENGGCALDNGGEVVELSESSGVVHARVRYNDRGRWPAAADGAGHSLELADLYSEQDDPDSFLPSGELGGSPGRANTAQQAAARRAPVRINEALLWTEGERWIELFNESDQEVDLSGFLLTDERGNLEKVRIADGTRIAPRGWVAFTETEIGLDLAPVSAGEGSPPRKFIALAYPDATGVVDAYIFQPEAIEMSEARIPDGDEDFSDRADPTPGAANEVTVEQDIVLNEILYHPIDDNPSAEFIELYNRGDTEVDLTGWRFSRGIRFTLPEGTVLGPREYLVVARDPDHIRETYGLTATQVIGPHPDDREALAEFGRLRDDGERIHLRDANGNLADTVRYHDGGRWPIWADGGGSSLELIDPWQNNNVAAAWDSSDDSEKAEVREYEHEGRFLASDGSPELRVVLLGRGIALIDDLTMFERASNLHPIETIIDIGDEWKYYKGTEEPSEPKEAWRQLDFDDSDPERWLTGSTPIGYGEGDETTLLEDMRGSYTSVYFRKKFNIPDISGVETLVLDIEFDDGFIAYLNGARISTPLQGNMRDGQDAFDDRARSARESMIQIDLSERMELLNEGENILAVQLHNYTPTSADARFVPKLVNGEFIHEDRPNVIANGDFEEEFGVQRAAPGFWFIEGTHVHSGRTTSRPISGDASMKVVATGRGDNKVNRIETTLSGLTPQTRHIISFKARWVVGAQTILIQGYDQNFPGAHSLAVPLNLGTPGEMNSATRKRLGALGSANMGPMIDKIRQEPSLPRPGEDTEISARVSDSDGVRQVRLYWSPHNPAPPESASEILMSGPDSRGRYTATIPGQPVRTRVVYYIVAEDAGGRTGRFPPDQLDRAHPLVRDPENPDLIDRSFLVYRQDSPQATRYLSYRFWMHGLNENFLARRRLHSNDLVEGSFLFENRDLYWGAQIRFSGSPFARGGWGESYRVAMPKDRDLHGAIKRFQMEDHQRGGATSALERLSSYLIRHNQGNIKVPFSYQWLVQWQVNDRVNQIREHVQYPNREFIQRWYENDDEGDFFEMDDRHLFNDAGSRVTNVDGRLTFPPYPAQAAQLSLPPDNKELYRWYFNLRQNDARDDYSHLIELARILTHTVTPDDVFDEIVWDVVDVEEFLRVWAIRLNTDDWDTWGARRGKNCYLYRPPSDGRWVLLPWDMELTYNDLNAFMPPAIDSRYTNSFQEVARMLNRPRIKRMYYGILKEMIDHQFHSAFLAPYIAKLGAVGMVNLDRGRPGGYIDRRRDALRGRLQSAVFPQVRLQVTTNEGLPFSTETSLVTIEGRAPVEVTDILATVDEQPPDAPVAVEFSNSDYFAWRAFVPLGPGFNTVTFLGFDTAGRLIDSDQIDVTVNLAGTGATFVRGDVDLSGRISVSDAVQSLLYQFAALPIACLDAADTDDDGRLNLTDAVIVLNYLFRGMAPPRAPFPEAGTDPSSDDLDCERGY